MMFTGLLAISTIPVSYTHLDVYKRQIYICSLRPPLSTRPSGKSGTEGVDSVFTTGTDARLTSTIHATPRDVTRAREITRNDDLCATI